MTKVAEEGDIWEWRAFGRLSPRLLDTIRAHPIRMGISDLQGEDCYLVSPLSEHNIKLRNGHTGWLLKFKLLLESKPDAIELYSETARMMFAFPVHHGTVELAAHFLNVTLPEPAQPDYAVESDDFVTLFRQATPALQFVTVQKVRSQFEFDEGWVEIADVQFPKQRIESLSVHAFTFEALTRILNRLQPDPQLDAMNYIAACRQWA